MSDVVFVFTNPRHHLEMMAPVAAELGRRGVRTALVSLAELRGFVTPPASGARRVLPFHVRRRHAGSAPVPRATPGALPASVAAGSGRARWFAQRLVWHLGLAPRLAWMLRGARVVVVPNDAVYPYVELLGRLHRSGVRTVLMQEGIRFPQLESYTGPRYGGTVSSAVCAWGEGSREFFAGFSQVPDRRIVVTGAPRLDDLDPASWRAAGDELMASHRLPAAPIAFLSNPIEIQGYGTREAKLDLFARFLAGAAPVVAAAGIPVIVKNHMHEDPRDYAQVAAQSPIGALVRVLDTGSTFAAIACARAVVVFTSTVGLEALMFDKPIGVLEIPGHEFAFEYVQRGAAVGIRIAAVTRGVEQLLAADPARAAAGQALVRRHLHDRGRARHHVADAIERVLSGDRTRGRDRTPDDQAMNASNTARKQ